jgi:hypothetical protein
MKTVGDRPLKWRKSTYSTAGNACVEVAAELAATHVRDSKSPAEGTLSFEHGTFAVFLAAMTG